jgi:hypothetical protein
VSIADPLFESRVALLVAAVMHAEGFWVHDALPRRHHNPGDFLDSEGNNIAYPDILAGVFELVHEVKLMLTGASKVYKPEMPWRRVAELYTGHDNAAAWCASVCFDLDVAPDCTLGQFAWFDDSPRDDAAVDQPAGS